MTSSFLRFLDHTQRRITVGRTPLDEWSARHRDLYLITHNNHKRQTSMSPAGFEPTISAGERPQTYALDRAASGTGTSQSYPLRIMYNVEVILWWWTVELKKVMAAKKRGIIWVTMPIFASIKWQVTLNMLEYSVTWPGPGKCGIKVSRDTNFWATSRVRKRPTTNPKLPKKTNHTLQASFDIIKHAHTHTHTRTHTNTHTHTNTDTHTHTREPLSFKDGQC